VFIKKISKSILNSAQYSMGHILTCYNCKVLHGTLYIFFRCSIVFRIFGTNLCWIILETELDYPEIRLFFRRGQARSSTEVRDLQLTKVGIQHTKNQRNCLYYNTNKTNLLLIEQRNAMTQCNLCVN
jgi:hypothetical protein